MTQAQKRRDVAARKAALWMLHALDVTGRGMDELLRDSEETALELEPSLEGGWRDVEARVIGVSQDLPDLNAKVQAVSPRWKLERMAPIDRNILRLGAWELLAGYRAPLDIINGCVDLGKVYGGKNTPGFVNGLLDQLCKNHHIQVK